MEHKSDGKAATAGRKLWASAFRRDWPGTPTVPRSRTVGMSKRDLVWLLLGLVAGLTIGAVRGLVVPRPGRYAPLNDPGAILVMDTATGRVWELSASDRLSHARWTAAPALPGTGSGQGNEGEKEESEATNPTGEAAAPSASAPPTRTIPAPPPAEQAPPPPPGKAPPAPPWQAPPAPPPTRR